MTEKAKNLGLRGDGTLHKRLRQLSVDTGKSVQRLFEDAIDAVYFAPSPASSNVIELPSPFEGLDNEQVFLIHNIIEILIHQPQGAMFRTLDRTMNEAVNEWRKTLKQNHTDLSGASELTSTHLASQPAAPALTPLEDLAIGRLLRILRSPKPGLPDAILSNLTQFEDTTELYERSHLDPAAGSPASVQARTRERDSGLAELQRDADAIGSGISQVDRRLEETRAARNSDHQRETKHPRLARKRS